MLLRTEEMAPDQLGITKEAWKIAAGLKPNARDLRLDRMSPAEVSELHYEPPPTVPSSGYVGPYPLREPDPSDAGS